MKIEIKTKRDTEKLAKQVSEKIKLGDVIALSGNLGAGKTFFTQKLCGFLGVKSGVNSPSYVIMNQYEGKIPIAHLDLYRLGSSEEVLELGLEEVFEENLTIVEWPKLAEFLFPKNAIFIDIEIKGNMRNFELRSRLDWIEELEI